MLEETVFDGAVDLGHADPFAEIADALGRIAAASEAAQGGQARIIPAGDQLVLDQMAQLALAHHGMVDAKAGELDLARLGRQVTVVDHPVVKRTMILELERAQGMRDALERILDRVGIVIHRVDAPGVARAVVMGAQDAVEDRVAHVHIAGGHVDLGAQNHRAIGKFAGLHAGKQVEGLLGAAVAPGAWYARAGQGAATLAHLLGCLLTDIGQTLFDQVAGQVIHFREIVRGKVEAVAPVIAEPVDVLLDRLDVFDIFLARVGVIHPQIADAAVFFRGAEIDHDRLGMADMQVAIRLGRETGMHGHAGEPATLGNIFVDELVDEMLGFDGSFGAVNGSIQGRIFGFEVSHIRFPPVF